MAKKDKTFYWIKLSREFMNGEIIDFLMSQKNGASYVVLYQMLTLNTINTQGRFFDEIGDLIVPYNIEKIQRECKWFDIDTVRVALDLYEKLGLICKGDEEIYYITEFEKLVGSETYWAQRKRLERERNTPGGQLLDNVQFPLVSDLLYLNSNNNLNSSNGSINNSNNTSSINNILYKEVKEVVKEDIIKEEIEVEELKVKAKEKVKKEKKPIEPKKQYGEYKHVKLKESQYDKLVKDIGELETNARIKYLDEYIQMKGYKATDHNLCLRKWVATALQEERVRHDRLNRNNREAVKKDDFTERYKKIAERLNGNGG